MTYIIHTCSYIWYIHITQCILYIHTIVMLTSFIFILTMTVVHPFVGCVTTAWNPPFVSRMKLGHYDDPLWGHGADKLGHSLQISPRRIFLHFSSSSKLGREDIFPHLETGSCWRCLFLVLLTILKWFEGFWCLLEVVWGFGCIWMHLAGFWSTIVWMLGKTWTKRDAHRQHLFGWVCRNSW